MYEDRMALFEGVPGAFALYMAFEEEILRRFPDTQIRIKKTQAGFFDGCGYAWAWPVQGRIRKQDKACIGITLGLPERLDNPRILQACEPYPGRWTHHLLLEGASQLDDELAGWIDMAHSFAITRKR